MDVRIIICLLINIWMITGFSRGQDLEGTTKRPFRKLILKFI